MAGIGSDAFQNDALLEQIPHWMFTFTNSGSDLLARSLAMIIARPETLARVREEIDAAGVPEDPRTIHRLDYLQACIFETGRLFPPVMQTAHRAEQRDVFAGYEIPAGTEILQFFPFNNRTTSRDGAGDFRPERWMSADAAERMRSSTLFLSGARACPGRDLILFVLKGAISIILHSECVRPTQNVLSRDPLPVMFPSQALRFLTRDIHVQ
jgi:cytochrome P450